MEIQVQSEEPFLLTREQRPTSRHAASEGYTDTHTDALNI